jgi:uncharacterized membrane protein (DUF106 family)
MNSNKKIILAFLVALVVASSAITILAVNAQTTNSPAFQLAITASNSGVNEKSIYTFTIKNTGPTTLGSINISIPVGFRNIENVTRAEQPSGQNWNVSSQDGLYFLLQDTSGQGLNNNQSVTFTFNALNPPIAGKYGWRIGGSQSTGADGLATAQTTITGENALYVSTILPMFEILGIAAGIAFLNSGLNRVLINYFIGWEQYRVMQKEMNEFRQEQMAAARANDKKQMEKLKKKQSQITNMQSKMMKPQMVQFGISFVYLIVWFLVLTPTFQNISMAYLPGLGPLPVFYLYPVVSLFLGLLTSRIIGIMPIDTQ